MVPPLRRLPTRIQIWLGDMETSESEWIMKSPQEIADLIEQLGYVRGVLIGSLAHGGSGRIASEAFEAALNRMDNIKLHLDYDLKESKRCET